MKRRLKKASGQFLKKVIPGKIRDTQLNKAEGVPFFQEEMKNNLNPQEQIELSAIFNRKYYEQTYFNGVPFACHLMLRLFQGLGALELLKARELLAEEIAGELDFIPKARYGLEWMLFFLSQEGFLRKSGEGKDARFHYSKDVKIEPEIFLKKGLELDAGISPTANLMEYVISQYPDFFRGTKTGVQILFAPDKAALWGEYFSNQNSGYCVYNSLGAFGMLKWGFDRGNVRLLEAGAGTGGATAALIDRLQEKGMLSRVSEYIFSDISPLFLRLGNRVIMSRTGEDFNYSLKKLDFEKPIVEQGIEENGLDVVYAVNALHVAKDLTGALKNIYQALKPGGRLIFCEYCRPGTTALLLQEFIFNLLDNFVEVNLDSDLRPVPGFLDYGHWKRNLEKAGFKNIEAVFNTDADIPSGLKDKVNILAAVIKAEKDLKR